VQSAQSVRVKLLVHVRVYIYVGDKLGLHITVVSHFVLVYLNIVVIRIMMIGISLIFIVEEMILQL
jgi:hypothetical protein